MDINLLPITHPIIKVNYYSKIGTHIKITPPYLEKLFHIRKIIRHALRCQRAVEWIHTGMIVSEK
ncbi:hypothetical protein D3C75_902120 [compost metagenome]